MISIDGPWFKDDLGRTLFLRGVNLGGSSKVPAMPDGATFRKEGFFDHRHVSFVNRPFPLAEADEHFSRLKSWGFNILRFLVTWEAVEHSGPGIYDDEYLAYLRAVIEKAGEYGFIVFIDPHEDVWSRFSGGDGAPGWTFELLGMNIEKFKDTGAAIVHQTHGDPFPRMIWATNNNKFAAATLFTLFFGGHDFAPQTTIEGVPVQEFLQAHYIHSMVKVAETLRDLPCVIGFNTLNEPARGYIELKDLHSHFGELQMGISPTPWQSFQLASGIPQKVDVLDRTYFGVKKTGEHLLNPGGETIWLPGFKDIWQENGLWGAGVDGQPELLQPNYFSEVNGNTFDFLQRHYLPFMVRVAREIRKVNPDLIIFIDNIPTFQPPRINPDDMDRIVFEDHWYDGVSLLFKRYSPLLGYDTLRDRIVLGASAIQKAFNRALLEPKLISREKLNDAPVLIGEIGIPYDMSGKKAYTTGNFSEQEKTFDRSMKALEANLLSYTLWNYTSDNTNQRGDLWNDEDLSIFSRDQQADPGDINSGGRALKAVVRPYPVRTAGTPVSLKFDYRSGDFEYQYLAEDSLNAPTEFYLPLLQYPAGVAYSVSNGRLEIDANHQKALHFPEKSGLAIVRFSREVKR